MQVKASWNVFCRLAQGACKVFVPKHQGGIYTWSTHGYGVTHTSSHAIFSNFSSEKWCLFFGASPKRLGRSLEPCETSVDLQIHPGKKELAHQNGWKSSTIFGDRNFQALWNHHFSEDSENIQFFSEKQDLQKICSIPKKGVGLVVSRNSSSKKSTKSKGHIRVGAKKFETLESCATAPFRYCGILRWFLGPGNFLAIGRFPEKICAASLLTSPTYQKIDLFRTNQSRWPQICKFDLPKKETWLHTGEMCKPTRWGRVRFESGSLRNFLGSSWYFPNFQKYPMNYQCFWPSPTAATHHIFLEGNSFGTTWKPCVTKFSKQKISTQWLLLNPLCTYMTISVPETVVFELDASKKKYLKKWAVLPFPSVKKWLGFWGVSGTNM